MLSASARADINLPPCAENPERLCGDIQVPLDRSNPAGAKISIHVEVIPHTGADATDEAIFITNGGPGSSATQEFIGDFLAGKFGSPEFAPLLETRDMVLIDQRGVGLSQAIDCPGLQASTPPDIYAAVAACGAQLGDASSLYGSANVARDTEDVRKALGVDKVDYYGASYAGVDAQAYASRFPDHLRSIVLDSPVRIVGADIFNESSVEAIVRAVRIVCKRSANCSADERNATDDLEALAKRLRRHPVDGVGYDAEGNPHTVHVTEGFLAKILWNDIGGFAAVSEVAATWHALKKGDTVPLLRLAAENDFDIFEPESDDPTIFSMGDNFARVCNDFRFPWNRNDSIAQRHEQWEDAVDDLERDDFEPFSIDAWLSAPPIAPYPDPCISWPAPNRPVEPPVLSGAKFPKVPTLVLSGDLDTGTTSADAKRVAALFPHSRFVEVANSGHHTAVNLRFPCAADIIVAFVDQLSLGDTSCAKSNELVIPSVGRFPLTADDAKKAKVDPAGDDHSTRTDRRVANVAVATMTDSFRRVFMQSEPTPGVGLRGGTFTPDFGPDGATVDFDETRFAEDVSITGNMTAGGPAASAIDATIQVDGPGGEDGTLHITGIWFDVGATTLNVRGELGGRKVALLVPAT